MMKSGRKEAVEMLLHGHGCASRLKSRIGDSTADDDGSVSTEDLAQSVFDCLSSAIVALTDSTISSIADLRHESHDPSSSSPSQEHHSSFSKRRKTNACKEEIREEYSIKDSPAPIYHDGYQWRKYGQKRIKASNFQRSYYRCAYKFEHECNARKQIQMIKDNPPVFRTTYLGRHSCPAHHQPSDFPIGYEAYTDYHEGGRMIQFSKSDEQSNMLVSPPANGQHIIPKDEQLEIPEKEKDFGSFMHKLIKQDDHDPIQFMNENAQFPSDDFFALSAYELGFGSPVMFIDAMDTLDQFDYGVF